MVEAKDLKKWKVVSDGTVRGTKIFAPDGEQVGRVTKLVYTINTEDGLSEAKLEIIIPELDLEISDDKVTVLKEEEDVGN